MALTLLEKEVIFKEDLEEIFGKRKFEKAEMSPKPKSEFALNGNGSANGAAKMETEQSAEQDSKVIPNA